MKKLNLELVLRIIVLIVLTGSLTVMAVQLGKLKVYKNLSEERYDKYLTAPPEDNETRQTLGPAIAAQREAFEKAYTRSLIVTIAASLLLAFYLVTLVRKIIKFRNEQ